MQNNDIMDERYNGTTASPIKSRESMLVLIGEVQSETIKLLDALHHRLQYVSVASLEEDVPAVESPLHIEGVLQSQYTINRAINNLMEGLLI